MNIKKILLVVAPAFSLKEYRDINPLPPMGLGYLAAVLKNCGFEVRILDCLVKGWKIEKEVDATFVRVGLPNNGIEKYVKEYNPDVIGINCQFSRQYRIYHEMFALFKKIVPHSITIGGGAHVTVCPEEVLKDPHCDYILLGEAEESLKELVTKIKKSDDVTGIDGLGWKADSKVFVNEKRKWESNLDNVFFPAYDAMDLEQYMGLPASHGFRHRDRFCAIITSRGCPAKCTFCSACRVWGNKYRMRSVENVITEMRLLKEKYSIEELMFEDDNVTANPKRAKELFRRMIEEKFGFVWDTPNGVGIWSIDEEMLDLMKKSGCINLNFPVESGSQYVLEHVIKKPINLNKVKHLTNYCKKIGLPHSMFLVIGMPGEKISDMWKSFHFAADCKCFFPHISVATPYPGTELFALCKEKGFFAREFSLDDLFIRSYLIKTQDWSEKDIKKILLRGTAYLRLKRLISEPLSFIDLVMKYIKNPLLLVQYIRRLI